MAQDLVSLLVEACPGEVTVTLIENGLGEYVLAYGRDVIMVRQVISTSLTTPVICGDTADMKRLARAILNVPEFKG